MNNIEGLTQRALLDDKRNVGLRCTLGTGDDIDAIETHDAEEFAGDAGGRFHLFAHYGYRSKIVFGCDVADFTSLYLVLELLLEHSNRLVGLVVLHTDGGGALRRCLRNDEDRDAVVSQSREDALVHTNHTYHTETGNGDQTSVVD